MVSAVYGPLLVDLEAPNGTFIDGRRLEPLKGAKLTDASVCTHTLSPPWCGNGWAASQAI